MNRHQAIYQFLSGFDIPAYASGSVPAEAEFPYLTYEMVDGDFLSGEVNMTVHVWYYTDTETAPNQKVFELSKGIGYGGKKLNFDDGAVWVKKGSPWCTNVPDENSKVKHRYLNIDLEFITMD